MNLEEQLKLRSENKCEICGSDNKLTVYTVEPKPAGYTENSIYVCDTCLKQIERKEPLEKAHWSVLGTSMWSEIPAVQIVSWRMLNRLKDESWAADNLDMLYLDDENLAWAKATGDHDNDSEVLQHKDANGNLLQHGDTVVLTKSLDVKGSSLNAKMGTIVRNIRLVEANTDQIEGRIEGQLIVILTKYVRKQN